MLLLNIPAIVLIPIITSLGNADIPTMFAIAMLAREVTRSGSPAARTEAAVTSSRSSS